MPNVQAFYLNTPPADDELTQFFGNVRSCICTYYVRDSDPNIYMCVCVHTVFEFSELI